ncbi:isochorismatase family cysteine hydrolase [Kineococcus sp. GCM10028916]|uniref:isochorismatase family cysteine hydrolase n=1 Tax=Kineococcus sp. GCM10028916 TaxID=3273394 RepID=UPI0036372268
MDTPTYDHTRTALLIVDPYNDFMSEGGQAYELTKPTADSVGFYENMRKLVPAVRKAGVQVVVVPHHRSVAGDFDGWRHLTDYQKAGAQNMTFEAGTWGGEFHPEFGPQDGDLVAYEHWAQNGFVNTDLDAILRQRDIDKIVLVGFIANSCVEATARTGMELGFHVTLVHDGTAAFSEEGMQAARVNGPTYAHAILSTDEVIGLVQTPVVPA